MGQPYRAGSSRKVLYRKVFNGLTNVILYSFLFIYRPSKRHIWKYVEVASAAIRPHKQLISVSLN